MVEDKKDLDNLTPEQRSEIGQKGGEAVSQDTEHMRDIGSEGGKQSHETDTNNEE